MKTIIIKLIQVAFVILVTILFLFLLVDCKMESEKIKLHSSIIIDENEKLHIELNEVRKSYVMSYLKLIDRNIIQFSDLNSLLPEKEIQFIIRYQQLGH